MWKYIVEFLGTLFLSFIIFKTGNYLAIGISLAVAVLLGGNISGGAFNPAIAVAMYIKNKIPFNNLILYIIVEILGAIAGLYLSNNINILKLSKLT